MDIICILWSFMRSLTLNIMCAHYIITSWILLQYLSHLIWSYFGVIIFEYLLLIDMFSNIDFKMDFCIGFNGDLTALLAMQLARTTLADRD